MKRIKDEIIDELLERQREGQEVFGPDGMVAELTKRMMERLLQAELDDHLGYERGERGSQPRSNTRNGKTTKRVKTDMAEIEVEVPRDREGTFEPKVVKKRQTRLPGFDDKVLSLYGKGMSTREIQGEMHAEPAL